MDEQLSVPFRGQADGLNEEVSELTALSFPPEEDRTRQEQRDSVDINKLMARHGVQVPMRAFESGDVDFDTDLMSAYGAVDRARAAYDQLDRAAREKYPTLGEFLEAVAYQERGTVVPGDPPPEVPAAVPAPGGGSPVSPVTGS